MTNPAQFQTQGAYVSPYFSTGNGAIYIGTDVDNSNASGSLCSVPYYKRGYVNIASGAGTQTVIVPGNTTIISLALENRSSAAFTAGTFSITGRGQGAPTQTLASVSIASLGGNVITGYANWGGTAPTSGGSYSIPDVGQLYATWTVSVASGAGGGAFLYFYIGMVDSDFNTTIGQ